MGRRIEKDEHGRTYSVDIPEDEEEYEEEEYEEEDEEELEDSFSDKLIPILVLLLFTGLFLFYGLEWTVWRDETKIENRVFELINDGREDNNIHRLGWDDELKTLSKEHSKYLLQIDSLVYDDGDHGQAVVDIPIWFWGAEGEKVGGGFVDCSMTVSNYDIAECVFECYEYDDFLTNKESTIMGVGVSCDYWDCFVVISYY